MSEDKMNKDKRSIFLRELLNLLLPIWTLPLGYEIRDKTQAVYKELTSDEVQSKVAKSAFDWSRRMRIAEKSSLTVAF